MKNAFITTVTAKGQFTIPKAIREHLGVTSGDRLAISVDTERGEMRFTPIRDSIVAETAGSLAKHVRRHT